MTVEEFLAGLAQTAHPEPTEFIGTLKTESGELLPFDKILEKFNGTIISERQRIGKEQMKRGARQRMEEHEQEVRDYYKVNSKATGLDLVKEIATKTTEGPTPKPEKLGNLSKEELEKLPLVQEIVRERSAEYSTKVEELSTQLEKKDRDFAREKVEAVLRTNVISALKKINARVPKDEEGNWKKDKLDYFLNSLNPDDYRVTKDGDVIPVDEKGDQLQNKQYQNIGLVDRVSQLNPWDVYTKDPDSGSAQAQSQAEKTGGKARLNFTDDRAFYDHLNTVSDRTKYTEMLTQWEAQKAEK